MTYKELLEIISTMEPEELAQNVTVYVPEVDEFYPIKTCLFNYDRNYECVVDDGDIYLSL